MSVVSHNHKTVSSNHLVKPYNSIFDIVKFVLSIAVVAIHSELFSGILYPWLRLAVPLFFMISSFLLFGRLKDASDQAERKAIVFGFVKRNLKLYLFWFIALLPITIFLRQYFIISEFNLWSVWGELLRIVRDFVFGSTFRASWFIMALVIAVVLVSKLSTHFNNLFLFIGALFVYILVVLRSSYLSFFPETSFVYDVLCFYETYLSVPYLSFPAALLWVVCGKWFAEQEYRYVGWFNALLILIFSFGLYVEWSFLKSVTGTATFDCYFFLLPLVVCIFSFLKNVRPVYTQVSLILRKYSVVIYALHGSVAFLLSLFIESSVHVFCITLFFCIVIAWIVTGLEQIRILKFLRFSH